MKTNNPDYFLTLILNSRLTTICYGDKWFISKQPILHSSYSIQTRNTKQNTAMHDNPLPTWDINGIKVCSTDLLRISKFFMSILVRFTTSLSKKYGWFLDLSCVQPSQTLTKHVVFWKRKQALPFLLLTPE